MKKYTSIFNLIVRSRIYRIAATLAIMVGFEALVFAVDGLSQPHLLAALKQVPFLYIIGAGLVILSKQLFTNLCDRGGKLNNAILRFGISEQRIFFLQAAFNILIYLLFFLVQGVTFLALCLWYDPAGFTDPTVLVTAYDHALFHTFLPLDDLLAAAANLLLMLGLGICTAAYPMRQRHNKRSMTTLVMILVILFYLFMMEESGQFEFANLAAVCVPIIVCIFSSLCGTLTLEVGDDG